MAGDLLYLTVKTLEAASQEVCITASVNGFYKNESTALAFNPLPSTKGSACYSYTLVGCLN
jgi:hypothetical protein